ncbi:HupE/UreJ family protein [Streptomyces sp. NPDC051315]|uniref:HupE/UreJ family protein n=1 Tax=Streptomyces sp. NPDC051315 TaxID=3365650 RepID=UPI003789DD56
MHRGRPSPGRPRPQGVSIGRFPRGQPLHSALVLTGIGPLSRRAHRSLRRHHRGGSLTGVRARSLTLALAASGVVRVPSQPVETLIALSIAVSAVHATRPLVARGEVLIAAGFGLVHGLAFASLIGDLGLGRGSLVTTLLGFNLGIGLTQLLVVALMMPSLLVLARTALYPAFRVGGASSASSSRCPGCWSEPVRPPATRSRASRHGWSHTPCSSPGRSRHAPPPPASGARWPRGPTATAGRCRPWARPSPGRVRRRPR